jgi:hypothetical protein
MTEQEISDLLYKYLDLREEPDSILNSTDIENTEVTFSLGETVVSCNISLN